MVKEVNDEIFLFVIDCFLKHFSILMYKEDIMNAPE